jgi:hypothetical protein
MRDLEAKDFLVRQTAEQAVIENVPLSDLEKRMMYWSETDECPEDPIALNDAFESTCDTVEYEAKISKIMQHAYQRIRKENPEAAGRWKEAMKQLSKGDHYLLVLGGVNYPSERPQERPPYDSLKLLGAAILLASAMLVFAFVWDRFGPHFPDSLGWIARRLIAYSLLASFFIGRHYRRKARARKYSGQA